jgi:hypothetical protein
MGFLKPMITAAGFSKLPDPILTRFFKAACKSEINLRYQGGFRKDSYSSHTAL